MEKLPSGLFRIVGDEEDLARFLIQSNQFNAVMVKPAAFLPNPRDRETSVSRHGIEPRADLWEIGLKVAGQRTLYGAAVFKANVVREAKLDVLADEPPPLHAVIRNWPWDGDPDMLKAQQKALALTIASQSELILR